MSDSTVTLSIRYADPYGVETPLFDFTARVGFAELCDPAATARAVVTAVPGTPDLAQAIEEAMAGAGQGCSPE